MLLTRKNAKGGAPLKSYTLDEDPRTGCLGLKFGYCEGCNEPIFIRTVEMRDVISQFGYSLSMKSRREPIKHKLIKFLGGRVGDA
jgi:hypothetical protein